MDWLFRFLFKYSPFLFEKGKIVFETGPSTWLVLALAAATAGAACFLYLGVRRAPGPDEAGPRPRRWWLILLRGLALATLILMLLRPSLVVSTLLPRENIVAVLVDNSKSMTIRDQGGETRLEAVKQLLDPAKGRFSRELERRFQTRVFSFSRENEPLESVGDLKAEGTATSLESALQGVLREFSSAPLASVVVVSDGADNASADLAAVLNEYRARKVSIATCGVGRAHPERDIEVVQATAPSTVLPDSITQAVVALKSSGLAGREAVVEVRDNGKLINSKRVKLSGSDEPQIVDLDLGPKGTGLKSYTVGVAPQEGEAITVNNHQNLLLNVEDAQPKVLYLEGTPRWEFKFIREAVEKDRNLQLVTMLKTSGNKFYRQGIESEDNLSAGYPTNREDLFQYKGLIIGSIEASFFSPDQLKMIADFVGVRGGGFMMIGGRKSFDAGNYGGTPIAEILPVVLGQRGAAESFLVQPVKMSLTSYGQTHPITRLNPDEDRNTRRWESLPEIGDFNWISTLKPGATALATGRTRNSPILLAAQRYGRGRALAFTADSSWRWRMGMPHTDDTHQVFWRQALRWLVGSAPDEVSLDLGRGIFSEDDTIRLSAEVNDRTFAGVNDAEVTASIRTPEGRTLQIPMKWSGRKDGQYFAAYRPMERGTHEIRVSATGEGKDLGSAHQFVLVADSNQEFFSAGQNQELLSHLSAQTGGKYYSLADAARLPEELVYQDRPNAVPQYFPLWDMPILFLIVCAVLTLEWLLRRRYGLA